MLPHHQRLQKRRNKREEPERGGLKLTYQGRKKDYLEEDSWKKEGFLPFGTDILEEEIPIHSWSESGGINEEFPFVLSDPLDNIKSEEGKASLKQLIMHTESIGVELKDKIIGQDDAIDKLARAFFHAEKRAKKCLTEKDIQRIYRK